MIELFELYDLIELWEASPSASWVPVLWLLYDAYKRRKSARIQDAMTEGQAILDDLRHDLDADRVALLEVTNGGGDLADSRAWVSTMRIEAIRGGVARTLAQWDRVDADGHFRGLVAALQQGPVEVMTAELPRDSQLHAALRTHLAHTAYLALARALPHRVWVLMVVWPRARDSNGGGDRARTHSVIPQLAHVAEALEAPQMPSPMSLLRIVSGRRS